MPVTGFEITLRRPVADGREFGDAGAYEEIKGVLKFAIDPEHPANERITDLRLAPRGAGGLVEFESDLAIVAPVDPSEAPPVTRYRLRREVWHVPHGQGGARLVHIDRRVGPVAAVGQHQAWHIDTGLEL